MWFLMPVVLLAMDPVILRKGQNLHSFASLLNLFPLSCCVVPLYWVLPDVCRLFRLLQIPAAHGGATEVLSIDICVSRSLGTGEVANLTGSFSSFGEVKGSTKLSSSFIVTGSLDSKLHRLLCLL